MILINLMVVQQVRISQVRLNEIVFKEEGS